MRVKVVVFEPGNCNRGKSGSIRAKVVVIWQSCCLGAKVVILSQKWLYSVKNGCNRTKLLYSGKSGSIQAKVVVFGQGGFLREKVVVYGQKWLSSDKSGCIRAKVVVIGQNGCNRGK